MPEAVIVAAVRTPIGRQGGTLAAVRAEGLAALVVKEVIARAGIDPGMVDADGRGKQPDSGGQYSCDSSHHPCNGISAIHAAAATATPAAASRLPR